MNEQEKKVYIDRSQEKRELKSINCEVLQREQLEMSTEKRSSGQLKRSLVVSVDTGSGGKITSG